MIVRLFLHFKLFMRLILTGCLVALLFCSCQRKKDYDTVLKNPLLYSQSVYRLNNVVMGNNFSPIVGSRNYLYANIAAYEVMAAGYPNRFNSLAGQLRELKKLPAPKPGTPIHYEFASLLAFCALGQAVTFPEGSMSECVDTIKTLALEHGMPDDVFKNSIAF